MKAEQKSGSEIEAMALGAIAGIILGGGFGIALTYLAGGVFTELGLIVVVHSALAMAAMGAWVAPSLASKVES